MEEQKKPSTPTPAVKHKTEATTTVSTSKQELKFTQEVEAENQKRVRNIDDARAWTVIGIKGCPWTEKAMALLKSKGETFRYVELNTQWQRTLIVSYNFRKSPAIMLGPTLFGSYAELENHYKCWYFSDKEKF